jgi:hypothetical protein
MQTFSVGVQEVSLEDGHIIARFDTDPEDTSICRLIVFHTGSETSVATFHRNGLVIAAGTFEPPPPADTQGATGATGDTGATGATGTASQSGAPKSGSKK